MPHSYSHIAVHPMLWRPTAYAVGYDLTRAAARCGGRFAGRKHTLLSTDVLTTSHSMLIDKGACEAGART